MSARLEGRVAVVTGAGSGFGEGIAKRFAEEGAAMRMARKIGSGAIAVTADVT